MDWLPNDLVIAKIKIKGAKRQHRQRVKVCYFTAENGWENGWELTRYTKKEVHNE